MLHEIDQCGSGRNVPWNNDWREVIEKLTRGLTIMNMKIPVLLAGDFNTRLDQPKSHRTQSFLATLSDFGLWVANTVTFPTFDNHRGSSVIDLFAVNLTKDRVEFHGQHNPLWEGAVLQNHDPQAMKM